MGTLQISERSPANLQIYNSTWWDHQMGIVWERKLHIGQFGFLVIWLLGNLLMLLSNFWGPYKSSSNLAKVIYRLTDIQFYLMRSPAGTYVREKKIAHRPVRFLCDVVARQHVDVAKQFLFCSTILNNGHFSYLEMLLPYDMWILWGSHFCSVTRRIIRSFDVIIFLLEVYGNGIYTHYWNPEKCFSFFG